MFFQRNTSKKQIIIIKVYKIYDIQEPQPAEQNIDLPPNTGSE